MKMDKKTFRVFIVLAVAALACTCDLLPGAETPPPPSPQADALFQDDFSDPGSGWEEDDYESGSVGYKDGAYSVTSIVDSATMWGVANRSFDNFIIEVDATQVSAGPDGNNDYGVVCREQGDGNGYYLLVSGDGFYAILRAEDGEYAPLVEWVESSAIRQGNATNHLRVICDGSKLELFVNGQHLATAEDSTYTSGDIALTATTYEEESTEVHFDNLVVSKP